MSYTIIEQDLYLKALKKLSKKYKHIEHDVENFLINMSSLDDLGIEMKLLDPRVRGIFILSSV